MRLQRTARVALTAILAVALTSETALAAPRDSRLDQVQAEVAQLEMKAESAAEEWNAA